MLRAWASHRTKVLDNWMQGRNQAIFASPTPSPALLVQPCQRGCCAGRTEISSLFAHLRARIRDVAHR